MNEAPPKKLTNELEKLKEEDIARVVACAKSSTTEDAMAARNAELRRLVGSIPKNELERIRVAIEEDCERIEHDRW